MEVYAKIIAFLQVTAVLLQPVIAMSVVNVKHSCLDYLKHGIQQNGIYTIIGNTGKGYTVYCDFTSEPGSAWTLVMSWALKHKNIPAFKTTPFVSDAPVNGNSPNMNVYRLPKARMDDLKSQSTHWRATCNYPKSEPYRDYVRTSFKYFDIMSYLGSGACRKVEFINIRGYAAAEISVPFWQTTNAYMLHIDSHSGACGFDIGKGSAAYSEDNFGHYNYVNKKFGCTENQEAVTQYWFGAYL